MVPLLYILYTSGISTLLTAHALLSQSYGDDVPAYLHILTFDVVAATRIMKQAMAPIACCMTRVAAATIASVLEVVKPLVA